MISGFFCIFVNMEQAKILKLSEIKVNPNNPRLIKDNKFHKLVQSIQDFPEMLNIRPIVVNADMVILGGNMRYKAAKEAGLKEVPVIVTNLSEDKQREFLIKDNVSVGEWDWDILANEWEEEKIQDWGLNTENFNTESFTPTLDPLTNYNDITKEQIKKEAEKLANQMLAQKQKIECMCPECGTEFEIDG